MTPTGPVQNCQPDHMVNKYIFVGDGLIKINKSRVQNSHKNPSVLAACTGGSYISNVSIK